MSPKDQKYRVNGFKKLAGETIIDVDASAINIVRITFASGKVVEIDAEQQHYGIGIVDVREVIK